LWGPAEIVGVRLDPLSANKVSLLQPRKATRAAGCGPAVRPTLVN